MKKVSLRHYDGVNKLYEILHELSAIKWSLLFLFSSLKNQILEMKDEVDIKHLSMKLLENYAIQYEMTIKNYYSKKDAISILL